MKITKLLAMSGVALALAGAAVTLPSAANAATTPVPVSLVGDSGTVSDSTGGDTTDGLNTCKVWYTTEQRFRGGSCYLMPSNTACWYTVKVKHTSCTRY